MITNFKLFESTEELIEELKIEDKSCWTIFGSMYHCAEILKKLKIQLESRISNMSGLIETFENSITDYPNAIGTNLFYDSEEFMGHFSFHIYKKESDRKYYFDKYEYKGEIKEVDDKIVLDTIEIYTNKYNL